MKKNRFRRARGDQDPGEVEPAFKRSEAPAQDEAQRPPAEGETSSRAPQQEQQQQQPQSQPSSSSSAGISESLFAPFNPQDSPPAAAEEQEEQGPFAGFENSIPQREGVAGERERDREESDEEELALRRSAAREQQEERRRKRREREKEEREERERRRDFFSFFRRSQKNNNNNNNNNANNDENSANNNNKTNGDNESSSKRKSHLTHSHADKDKAKKSLVAAYLRRLESLHALQRSAFVYPFYRISRWAQLGYDREPSSHTRSTSSSHKLVLPRHAHEWTVGVVVRAIDSFAQSLSGLVRPFVKILAVDINTGLFLSVDSSAAENDNNTNSNAAGNAPLTASIVPRRTTTVRARDGGSSAVWDEEVLLSDAEYTRIAREHTLLLFEVVDERPSLSTSQRRAKDGVLRKPVAWGFLRPVGVDGQLHIGCGQRLRRQTDSEKDGSKREQESERAGAVSPRDGDLQREREGESETGGGRGEQGEKETASTKVVPPLPLGNIPAENKPTDSKGLSIVNPPPDDEREEEHQDVHLRIQLYRYKRYDGVVGGMQRALLSWPKLYTSNHSPSDASSLSTVPSVYLQYSMLRKKPIKGAFLRISIGSRTVVDSNTARDTYRTADSEAEAADPSKPMTARSKGSVKEKQSNSGKQSRKRRLRRSKEERTKLRAVAMRRTRGPKDPCVIPDKFLNRLQVGPEGAMAVAFSHSGHLLAVASRMTSFHNTGVSAEVIYSIRLFDTDLDEEVWCEEAAHHDFIYDLQWSKNDRFLLSCAGDGTCKIWDLLALSPVVDLYMSAYNVFFGKTNRAGGGVGGDDETVFIGGGAATARTLNTYATAGNQTIEAMNSSLNNGNNNTNTATDALFAQGPLLAPAALPKVFPVRAIHVLSLATQVRAYCGVFQDFANYATPSLPLTTIKASDDAQYNASVLSAQVEQLNALKSSSPPRVLVGCSDGRIRVFDKSNLAGYVVVSDKSHDGAQQDFSPHDGVVNALAIDERSKYLISADSFGDILAWRMDQHGWYQLLRKFKRDIGPQTSSALFAEQFNNGSVLSLAMHPDKLKGLMLVLSRQPSMLRVVNMVSYKPVSYCEAFNGIQANVVHEDEQVYSTGVFHRAQFSADGRFIVCCVQDLKDRQIFRLQFWDAQSGRLISTPLSQLSFPYPVRSIAWHPTQHLIAVCMVGMGAAVNLYSSDQDVPLNESINAEQKSDRIAEANEMRRSVSSLNGLINSTINNNHETENKKTSTLPTISESPKSAVDVDEKTRRREKLEATLAKIRASRQR